MIATSDLRLGNWVHDSECTRYPMYVHTIGEDYVYLNFDGNEGDVWECKTEELQGIPLTEELLEKMDFFHNGVWWRKQDAGYAVDVSVSMAYAQIEKWVNCSMHSRCTCHGLRFVHELQNLFRDITKQELKIKL